MAAPDLGTIQLRQVRRGFEASLFFIALALALLPVLIPDGADGFRIRDIGAASTEHTRTSCNPLFGKCNAGQKVSGISSSTIRLRRKFEGTNTPSASPRTNKIQSLVEESSEDAAENEGRFPIGSVHVKTKLDKLPSLETEDNVKSYLRTSNVAKNSGGYSGPAGNAKFKASLVSSDEDNEGGEDYENQEDDDADNDVEENSEDDIDEDNVSESHESEMDDGTDEEEEKEETTSFDDDDDDVDEDDGNEQDKNEDEQDSDSEDEDVKSAESSIDRLARIKYSVKDVKQDLPVDRRSFKVPITRSVDKGAAKKSIEIIEEVRKPEIVKERREGAKTDDKTTEHDDDVSEQSEREKAEEEIIDTETVENSEMTESDHEPHDDDDDDDDEEKDDGNRLEVEATKPPRKLEKVRHADKSKSMESLRAISLEELSVKAEPLVIEKDVSEVKKVEVPKPTPKTEVKQPSKPVEKVNKPPASRDEVQKLESREKSKKVTSEPKPESKPRKEVKSQPKQTEKSKVKPPEEKVDKKSKSEYL